jgi:acyl dehydratase
VLSLRITVTDARRSRSKPDQGIVKSLVEVLNQKGEAVMSLNPVSLMRCQPVAVSLGETMLAITRGN